MYWIYDIPTEQLALLITGGTVLFAWIGYIVVRPFLRVFVRARSVSNDTIGYVLSCFGVFYGLLLGLTAVAAYSNYGDADYAVIREAAALGALYRNVAKYPEPHGQNLRWLLREYCRYVIKHVWPAHQKGQIPTGGETRIEAFHERLLAFAPSNASEEILHAESLRQFNVFLEQRRLRHHAVTAGMPAVMWFVLIVGTVINIVLVWLFDMRFSAHLLLGGLLAFFLGTMIFLIAAMDNPFRGAVSIGPEPFQAIYRIMMEDY